MTGTFVEFLARVADPGVVGVRLRMDGQVQKLLGLRMIPASESIAAFIALEMADEPLKMVDGRVFGSP